MRTHYSQPSGQINYAPTVQDQRGAIMAQGIQQAASAFSQGIRDYYDRKQQQQQQDAAIEMIANNEQAVNGLFPQLANVQDPIERRKMISAGIKKAGLQNVMGVGKYLQEQQVNKREADARAQLDKAAAEQHMMQTRKLEAELAAQNTEGAARQAAFDPIAESQQAFAGRGGYITRDPMMGQLQSRAPSPIEAVQAYGRAGGQDAKFIEAMGKMQDGAGFEPTFTPADSAGGPKGGVIFRSSPKSAQYVPPVASGPVVRQIGPRRLILDPETKKYFDEQGQPVETGGKPMSYLDYQMAFPDGTDAKAIQASYRSYLQKYGIAVGDPGITPPAGAPAQPDADGFVVGKTYQDKTGAKARYLGAGKWQAI